MDAIERARRFLSAHEAEKVEHLSSDLATHLEGTLALLEAWDAPERLRLAGLCHAAYGTDGFPPALIDASERTTLRDVIGERAEEIVYVYAACDRSHAYPQLGVRDTVVFRDRFTGDSLEPSDEMLRDFVELTYANELELALRVPEFARCNRSFYLDLFARCRAYASRPAYAAFLATFDGS
jgi:hypothetical protein